MAHEDERPILVCRVECPADFQAPLDAWMPKHFDDSLAHEAVTSAHSYEALRDWKRLPALFNDHGNRFIVYVADDVEGLKAWVDGPELREAIQDGVDRESQYPPLDDEAFNGTIYAPMEVRRPAGADVAGARPDRPRALRGPGGAAAGVRRVAQRPAPRRAGRLAGRLRVRTYRQLKAEVPDAFPFDRYIGKGNRMVWVELREGADVRALLDEPGVRAAIADSQRWDLRVPYVRREVCEHLLTRMSGDLERETAAATQAT